MTTAALARRILHRTRAIAGQHGLRPYTVKVVTTTWTNETTSVQTETTLAHAGGQPPKVDFLSREERFAEGIQNTAVRIGPLTPQEGVSGFTLAQLDPSPGGSQSVRIVITGPQYPSGTPFAIVKVEAESALGYFLVAEESDTGLTLR